MTDKEYTAQLESIIKQMLRPLNGVPLNLVIESISNAKVLPFDKKEPSDINLLNKLIEVANKSGRDINRVGITSRRANEVGNKIEHFVVDSLNSLGLKASIPKTRSGKARAAGYPDIYFSDKENRHNYLECKTYNIKSLHSSLRAFYLSPSKDSKIIYDAHHFVLSFEIFEAERLSNLNLYKCKSWKLLSVDKLNLNVKYEFNASNKNMYDDKLVLAEGLLN